MILLNILVDNINTVLQVYDQIQIQRSSAEDGPFEDVVGLGPVTLLSNVTSYTVADSDGLLTDWYISRYYSTTSNGYSAWSSPVLGETEDLYYNPLYPSEISYGTSDQLVIDRIRLLIGDPLDLVREHGTEASANLHEDAKVYELGEKGWPVSINMDGTQYTTTSEPTVNGYKYLKFSTFVDTPLVTYSGTRVIEDGIDIWYYSFRWSDREIMRAYNNTPPPPPLTTTTANAEVYMLACAYDLLMGETWDYISEDGATVTDEGTRYDPSSGIRARKDLLDAIRKRLDDVIKSLTLTGITGVLID